MKNIVVMRYRRDSSQNYGCIDKTDRSWYCQGGEFEAKTLLRYLTDNLIEAKIVSQEKWDKLPDEYSDNWSEYGT